MIFKKCPSCNKDWTVNDISYECENCCIFYDLNSNSKYPEYFQKYLGDKNTSHIIVQWDIYSNFDIQNFILHIDEDGFVEEDILLDFKIPFNVTEDKIQTYLIFL